jgi:hypothetical protein
MATFSLIIDGAFAFNLDVVELTDGFYDTIRNNPKVVECSGLDVSIGNTYVEGTFYQDGTPVSVVDINPYASKFAFIVSGIVSLVHELSNDNQMLVAAYSSDPSFIEMPSNE